MRAVNLQAIKGYGGIAVFILIILDGLSGQLCAPPALNTGKYPPLCLAVQRGLHWCIEVVWTCSRRDKYLAPARKRTTIPKNIIPCSDNYTRGVQTDVRNTL